MSFLTYWLYPNLAPVPYSSPKVMSLLILCGAMVVASFVIKYWRKSIKNPVTKRLSSSWSSASLWFGVIGLILVVARVESISYVSMHLWWAVWFLVLALYAFGQYKLFRARHYEPVASKKSHDPRADFLPKKKKK